MKSGLVRILDLAVLYIRWLSYLFDTRPDRLICSLVVYSLKRGYITILEASTASFLKESFSTSCSWLDINVSCACTRERAVSMITGYEPVLRARRRGFLKESSLPWLDGSRGTNTACFGCTLQAAVQRMWHV